MIEELETESKTTIDWSKSYEMNVNPDKFQAVIVNGNSKMRSEYFLNIREAKVATDQWVSILEIKTDRLSLETHISSLCRKGSNQLNAINWIKRYMGFKEK